MAELSYSELTKVFDDGTVAVDKLKLAVADGEFVVLVGPSGCGKTTTLMMTAGLEYPTSGDIQLDGQSITMEQPKDRDIAMVFQSYALYPHMTVEDNIAFGLRRRRVPKPEVKARVMEAARTLDLEQLLGRKPAALSGGQRQRVAMGRAMVRRPRLFLMDEPLSNLDAKLRVQMRAEIKQLQRDLGVTTIYVTHDQTEAMTMGDRIAVMRRGILEQFGTPHELYRTPNNIFVAQFIGSPAMNLVKAEVNCSDDGATAIRLGSTWLTLDSKLAERHEALRPYNGRAVVAGFRPESLTPQVNSESRSALPVKVEHVEDIGSELIVYFHSDLEPIVTEETREIAADVDEVALERLEPRSGGAKSCIARFAADTPVSVGDQLRLAVDLRRLHVFDTDSGDAISIR